jgi:hypothetical protein
MFESSKSKVNKNCDKMFRRFSNKILGDRGALRCFLRGANSEVLRKTHRNRQRRGAEAQNSTTKLKQMIVKELMKNLPQDLTKLKLFELKIVTKTIEVKSEGF